MTARTHDLFALTSLVACASFSAPTKLTVISLFVILVANIVGACLPDLDQATNRLWDMLPAGNLIGRLLRRLFLSHRTLSHSFLGFYLIHRLSSLILPQLLNPQFINIDLIYYSLLIGFISHLFLDFLTEEGIPLFFPLKLKIGFPPIRPWRIKTGGWFEKYVIFLSVAVIFLYLVANRYRQILAWFI